MNTNPRAVKVLCYGDSNTNGTKPDRSGRYTANERWPGVLQDTLGEDYYVIEEGLGGRTTNLEHPNPEKPSRNGIIYFKACLESHSPSDIIIIMLGSNDLKTTYNRSAKDIAEALREFPDYVHNYCRSRNISLPRIILVSPAHMNADAPKFAESMPSTGIYSRVSTEKSKQLAAPIKKIADETDCEFFDAATVTETGEDGCHLNKQSHVNLANAFANLIKN